MNGKVNTYTKERPFRRTRTRAGIILTLMLAGILVLAAFPMVPAAYADLGSATAQVDSAAFDAYSLAWGDWDADGDEDLALGIDGQNRVYANEAGTLTLAWTSTSYAETYSVAWADWDGDNDLDLAVGSDGFPTRVYENDSGTLQLDSDLGQGWEAASAYRTRSVAWGDWDGDNDLDLAVGNYYQPNQVYANEAGTLTLAWESTEATPSKTRSVAWGDWDGDGIDELAVGNDGQANQVYAYDGATLALAWDSGSDLSETQSVAWGDWDADDDLDLAVGNEWAPTQVYANDGSTLTLAWESTAAYMTRSVAWGDWNNDSALDLAVGNEWAADEVYVYDGSALELAWESTDTDTTYAVAWGDLEGDNDLDLAAAVYGGEPLVYINELNDLDPDGNQIRVLNGTEPVANALVYRLPGDQDVGGQVLMSTTSEPLLTDEHGYIQGSTQINIGDRLFAMAPIEARDSQTLYYTNGTPTEVGVQTASVTEPGLHELTVSADNPLVLFHLDVSIEWDATSDPTYLPQLEVNLQRASQYLYDITNGQAALGDIVVSQNADDWAYSHIVVHATNNLRPYATQGGIVNEMTVDPEHPDIIYDVGQIAMGATWNRYGNPGYDLSNDWPLVLAHELGHYVLFQDEVYLGIDEQGNLIAVDECVGSIMGDPYTDERNTELIADDNYWNANCTQTLAHQTLARDEWDTMQIWYEALQAPDTINPGPSLMPFELTQVQIEDPITSTNALEDPTFYLDYEGALVSSQEARAYLLRDDYVVDVGSPVGGQNRILARGAQPGDQLCVFDRARRQYGCEEIMVGDDRLSLEEDLTWTPVMQINPVDATTLDIRVENLDTGLPLHARLYPEYGTGEAPIVLNDVGGGVYEGTFNLSDVAMAGNIRMWIDENATENDQRRETMVAYSIGGNPGARRSRSAELRGSGGARRSRSGDVRGSDGARRSRSGYELGDSGARRSRSGYELGDHGARRSRSAALLSSDGQMIFFTPNPIEFAEGQFYTIQDMAGLPQLPAGRTVIGRGYNMVSTPGAPMLEGSIAFEYMERDVVAAGASEANLTIYHWDGTDWTALPTVRDPYYNLASTLSQGTGVYVLMSSVEIGLEAYGWNLIGYPVQETRAVEDALQSIEGKYRQVLGHRPINGKGYFLWGWDSYIPNLPPMFQSFNTLDELRFGKGYFINATEPTRLYLEHDPETMTNEPVPLAEGMPTMVPATYYGVVEPTEDFTPAAGMPVVAKVNGNVCGETTTQDVDGQIIYMVMVAANEPGVTDGCGTPGSTVTFIVDNQPQATTAAWNTAQPAELSLHTELARTYLPMVSTGR